MHLNNINLPGWMKRIKAEKVLLEHSTVMFVFILCIAIIIVGWSLTNYFAKFSDSRQRDHFIAEAQNAAVVFEYTQILSLQGIPEDSISSNYKNIVRKLILLKGSNPDYRFVYLMAFREGKVIFLADAEAPDSADYSAPGDIYQEASPELINVFKKGTTLFEGPISDKWGTWVSAIAPIKNHDTGNVIAVIGFDINAQNWLSLIAIYKGFGILITGATLIIILISVALVSRFKSLSAARQARDDLRAIITALKEGVVISDSSGCITSINPIGETIMGVRLNNIAGKPIESIIKKKISAEEEWPVNLEKEFSFDFEFRNPETENTQILNANVGITRDKQGKSIGHVISFHDTTLNHKIEKLKSEIITTAAHELRTPLTSIRGFSELLLNRTNFSETDKQKYLKYINEQSVALGNIIDDLMDISRIEKGMPMRISPSQFEFQSIAKEQAEFFKDNYPKHHIWVDLPAEPLVVHADRGKFDQVLKNLLSNAVKFSPEGGDILIRAEMRDTHALISVWDKGIGMTPGQVQKIFDKFYRVDASTKAPEGIGLGMTIVKYIIEGHGGKICVDSEIGEGTSVHFTLPLASIELKDELINQGKH